MVGLVERISAYRIGPDGRYPFPLLQRHIADLTGLTHVHVSRVLSEFRDAGVMNLSKGYLTIVNLTDLERIAQLD
jgi:CRP/FNR family transcriptional regulator, anaerobic regulatory protein